jgi:exopolyphosphatase/guanosine-5'-triphosphate,3'-diphosphate pyrophosphatase
MTYSAAIDIGTHSALLLIARCRNAQVDPVVDLARTTKLGAGLSPTGQISSEGMERLGRVLESYRAILSEYPIAQLTVFATAAFRQASNAADCAAQIQTTFGWPLRILTGDEEANYTFRGICQLIQSGSSPIAARTATLDRVMAIDIGGGSTEVILGQPPTIHQQQSYPVGVLGLKQQLQLGDQLTTTNLDRIEAWLHQQIDVLPLPVEVGRVIITGGTATTIAALLLEMTDYDFRRIDGFCCPKADIELLLWELNRLTPSQRTDLPGMEPGRSDVILPALCLLWYLVKPLPVETITVSIRGARYGIVGSQLPE